MKPACVALLLWVGLVYIPAARAAEFDPSNWPAHIGETLAAVLARWGESASFGADCGSWRGPSVDTTFRWKGQELRVMGLLRGDRLDALRFEQAPVGGTDLPQCQARLQRFAAQWSDADGLGAGEALLDYDGPTLRTIRSATKNGGHVGTFEADYRASRLECRVALIRTAD